MQLQTSIKFSFAHFRLTPNGRFFTSRTEAPPPLPDRFIMLSPAGSVMPGPIGHLCRTPPTLNCHARHESAASVQEKGISRTDAVPNRANHPEKRSVGARNSPNSPRRLSPKKQSVHRAKSHGQTAENVYTKLVMNATERIPRSTCATSEGHFATIFAKIKVKGMTIIRTTI